MSVLDSIIYSIKCNNCNNEESIKLLDRGNIYSGSLWDDEYNSNKFDIVWSGGCSDIPIPKIKCCKLCGSQEISINSRFKV